MKHLGWFAVFVGGSLLCGDARSQSTEVASAHFQAGVEASKIGDHAKAVAEFHESMLASHRSSALYNLGREMEVVGEPTTAVNYFNLYLLESPGSKDRLEVEGEIQKLGGKVGTPSATLATRRVYPVKNVTLDGQTIASDRTIIAETVTIPSGATIVVAHGAFLRVYAAQLVLSGTSKFDGHGDKGTQGVTGTTPVEWSTRNMGDFINSCRSDIDRGGDGGPGGPGGAGATILLRYERLLGDKDTLSDDVSGGPGGDGGRGGDGRVCRGPHGDVDLKRGPTGRAGPPGPVGPAGTFAITPY